MADLPSLAEAPAIATSQGPHPSAGPSGHRNENVRDDVGPLSARKGIAAAPSPAAPAAPTALQPSPKRQRRQRVLVDVHNLGGEGEEGDDEEEGLEGNADPELAGISNDYERQRAERIRRNEEVMRAMGLAQLAAETAAAARPAPAPGAAPPKPRRRAPAGPRLPAGPRRSSARNRAPEEATGDALAADAPTAPLPDALADPDDYLLDQEEYFTMMDIDYSGAVRVDGHFRGWVAPDVAQRYGLPAEHPGDEWLRAAAAAAGGGGGGARGGGGKRGRRRGGAAAAAGSEAKSKASGSLSHNPNAYFYRHVAPHQRQAQGEWTPEEHAAFMAVVRRWGAGDNWGLFASHIPQRVGYQCSAFYRDVVIPSGQVLDGRFKMARNGKAVFVR